MKAEFEPGYWHDSCSTAHNLIQASPMLAQDELGLGAHGLEYLQPDPVVHLAFGDGSWLTMWRDEDRTCAEFAKFNRRDADAYSKMMAAYRRIAPGLSLARYTPLGFGETTGSVLGRQPDGPRWLRRNAMSAWEVIAGEFADDHTRAFMLWMSFMTMQPPERPGTGLLAYSLAYGRQRHSWTLPRGGSAAQSGELRPVPGWASHRMPIAGLYQTGATTHPGGSVSGAPGRNAATVILNDLGLSISQG